MPLLWVSIAFLTGILLGELISLAWVTWLLLGLSFLVFTFIELRFLKGRTSWLFIGKVVPIPLGVVLLFFSLGALRFSVSIPNWTPSDLAFYNDRGTYTITALVAAPPDKREDAVYLEVNAIEVEDLLENNPATAIKKVKGTARVRLPATSEWHYGDLIQLTAKPLTPSEDIYFSYKDYLSHQGIHTVIYYPQHVHLLDENYGNRIVAVLEQLRQSARTVIFRQFPQPESGLLAGILLGLDNDLPASLKKAYRDTGTAHIIAISGFNMAVLAGLFLFLFSRLFNRYLAAALASLVLVTYTLFVGGSPSVVRAAIMAVAAFGGHLVGRRQMGLNALGFTAALMCLVNPHLPWDVSFQLSFAATLGLVVFGKPLQDWAVASMERWLPEDWVHRLSGPLGEYFLFTIAAQVTTLPIIALQFGRISASSLLANPLILPAQPAVLILGGIATIAGMLLPIAGKALAMVAWPILAYTNWMVENLAKIKGGSLVIHTQLAVWIGVIVVLFLALFLFRNFFKIIFGGHFIWLIFLLGLASAAVWSMVAHRPDGRLHLDLYRAGDESNLVLRAPDGQTILVNPGSSVNELSASISRQLSPWEYKIDDAWLTNRTSGADLAALHERIPVGRAVLTPSSYMSSADQRPVVLPPEIQVVRLSPGGGIDYGSNLFIQEVAEDIDSAVLMLTYQDIRILVPNGVDYALIKETSPAALQDLDILILNEDDLSYIPARVWLALKPGLVLWNSATLAPVADWSGADASARLGLTANGTDWWFEVQ